MDILLHILKEGSEEHGEMQAVNHFSLCLLKDLKAIVNGDIQSGKIQWQNISCLEDCWYVAFEGCNIIHEVLWYEYIYDEAMNVIEDHLWAGDWIYANFQPPVQSTEAKRLEKCFSDNAHFSGCFKVDLGRRKQSIVL